MVRFFLRGLGSESTHHAALAVVLKHRPSQSSFRWESIFFPGPFIGVVRVLLLQYEKGKYARGRTGFKQSSNAIQVVQVRCLKWSNEVDRNSNALQMGAPAQSPQAALRARPRWPLAVWRPYSWQQPNQQRTPLSDPFIATLHGGCLPLGGLLLRGLVPLAAFTASLSCCFPVTRRPLGLTRRRDL